MKSWGGIEKDKKLAKILYPVLEDAIVDIYSQVLINVIDELSTYPINALSLKYDFNDDQMRAIVRKILKGEDIHTDSDFIKEEKVLLHDLFAVKAPFTDAKFTTSKTDSSSPRVSLSDFIEVDELFKKIVLGGISQNVDEMYSAHFTLGENSRRFIKAALEQEGFSLKDLYNSSLYQDGDIDCRELRELAGGKSHAVQL